MAKINDNSDMKLDADTIALIEVAKKKMGDKQYNTARRILTSLIPNQDLSQCHPRILKGLGYVSEKLEDYDDVLLYFKFYIEKQPKDIKILDKIAQILFDHNQMEEAEYYYNKILSIKPNDSKFIYQIGKIKEQNGDIHGANDLYKKAIDVDQDGGKPCIFHKWGCLLWDKMGDINKAKYCLEQAVIKSNSNNVNKKKYEEALKAILMEIDEKDMMEMNECILDQNDIYKIKLIIWNFDLLILWTKFNIAMMNIEDIEHMKERDIINIFGGNSRIDRHRDHFDKLKAKNIKLIFYSFYGSEIVWALLNRIGLSSFFDKDDIITYKQGIKSIVCLGEFKTGNILYIDTDKKNKSEACRYCKIINLNCSECNINNQCNQNDFMSNDYILPGTRLIDLQLIERIFNAYDGTTAVYNDDFPYSVPDDMMEDKEQKLTVYNNIKTEIDNLRGSCPPPLQVSYS